MVRRCARAAYVRRRLEQSNAIGIFSQHEADLMNTKKGKQTFIVEVIASQKCTWQGQIHWIQGDKKKSFRSVMEMLHLMDSVIADGNSGEEQGSGTAKAE